MVNQESKLTSMSTGGTPNGLHSSIDYADWNDLSQPLAKDIDWPITLEPQGSVGIYTQIDPAITTAINAQIDWKGENLEGQKLIAPLSLQHIPQLTDD